MKSTVIKRSIVIAQHKTSISLEEEFWIGLKDIARARQMALSPLVLAIRQRHQGNLSSAIRVFVFDLSRAGTHSFRGSLRIICNDPGAREPCTTSLLA